MYVCKKVTWESFAETCIGTQGIRFRFEDLCRQLFVNKFLSANKKSKYVHCNPNNTGLESDPVYDEINNRWIGYQAKFFDNRPGYNQILHSAQKMLECYSGKLDHVFLYSNKQLSVEADGYKKAVNLLSDHNITLELITGDAILDQVREYQYLAECYFGCHLITQEWIVNHNEHMFAQLRERFNHEFNVDPGAFCKSTGAKLHIASELICVSVELLLRNNQCAPLLLKSVCNETIPNFV